MIWKWLRAFEEKNIKLKFYEVIHMVDTNSFMSENSMLKCKMFYYSII